MQLTIVIIVIVIAVAYAAYRIYQTVSGKKSSCDGCPIAEKCSERQHKQRTNTSCCNDKKDCF